MIVENDVNKVTQIISGKVVDSITRDVDGLIILFKDGSKIKIKTYQYQIIIL